MKQNLKKSWLVVPKMTLGIWWILMWAVASLKMWTLMCYFCQKYITFELKKYRGVMCHNSAECAKFEEELTCAFKNDIEFDKFWPNNWKFQNLHFNGLFFTKVYKLVNFTSGFRLQLMHISLIKTIRSSLTHLHGFQLLVLLP